MSLFDLPFEEPTPEAKAEPEPEREPPARKPPASRERRIHTVSELTRRIRMLLEEEFVEVWVEGELSNCKVWNTGHMYFTLKDSNAQIKGVMFRSSLLRLRFKPQDGLRVVARGRVSVYDPKGEYQLVCEHFEPEGLGARQLAFDQLKQRLSKEGLFDERRKRALPALPRKIGVITSLISAYYYLRVVVTMYMQDGEPSMSREAFLDLTTGLTAVATVVISLVPQFLFAWATNAVLKLF
jgi:hypothetical protein